MAVAGRLCGQWGECHNPCDTTQRFLNHARLTDTDVSSDNTGYGFHADFISSWDEKVLNDAMQQCNNGGDISQCGPLKPYLQSADDGNRCILAPTVSEQVMGKLDKLPGNNPVGGRS
jgi:hypothetical protein